MIGLRKLMEYRATHHIAFWVVNFLFFFIIANSNPDNTSKPWQNSVMILLILASFLPAVYFNISYLIPKYFFMRRYLRYAALAILTALLTIPILFYSGVLIDLWIEKISFEESMSSFEEKWFTIAVWSFFNVALYMTLTGGLKFAKHWYNQQQKTRELENRNLQSELKFLKSQVNPHFLFNTLNNLYSLTLKKDDRAPETVLKLSELMRYMLYECNERRVPLDKEINCIRNYIDLERIRQGDKTKIDFDLEGHVNGHMIAPLLFIPFLENSFKHGVNSQIREGWVDIKLNVDDDRLDFSVVNGKGMHRPISDKKSGGIGLENVKRRLNLSYPDKHKFKIIEDDTSFRIDLKLFLQ